MGSGSKQRWKISFHRSPSSATIHKNQSPPLEFLCPISGSLMFDPVIVSSGHTFERNCVLACKSLSYFPTLSDGSVPDFSTVIPNMALKAAIISWCRNRNGHVVVKPIDYVAAENIVRGLRPSNQNLMRTQLVKETELTRTVSQISTSSDESVTAVVTVTSGPTTPLPLTTRPSCYSSSSSSDVETLSVNLLEEDEVLVKLKSPHIFEQEEGLVSLRRITRTREDSRVRLCTQRILLALRLLIVSKYASIQVNSVAGLVNLSLENENKVKIVRSGIVPPLIDVLKGGFSESQEHAAGALFSLALEDVNKTAIGVLGALPPLLHAMRSDSERTRHDSAMALYHLSLVQSNRVKMVKLGSVHSLLCMVRSGHMTARVLLVLCNLTACPEGRAAMLDGAAVECFMTMLSRGEFDSESTRESCVTALYGLSHGGLRFKGLAKEAGAEEVLRKVEGSGSQRSREKVGKILELLREKDEDEEEVDWEELLNSDDDTSQTR